MQPVVERSAPASALFCVTFAIGAGPARRIAVEEGAPASHLGPEWTAFARTRKRLIPLVG